MNEINLALLLPEIFIISCGIVALILDLIFVNKKVITYFSLLSVLLTMIITIFSFPVETVSSFYNSFSIDPFSHLFKLLFLFGTFIVILLSIEFKNIKEGRKGVYHSLLLFACCAMMFISSSNDLIMIFVSIEFLSITSYILVGFTRENIKSTEAAIKYFLIGAFSSAIMLYGMSLLFGITKSTNLSIIQTKILNAPETLLFLSIFLILVGFGFKIALVPFHMWVPDVYEGAPTPITTYLSIASKAAGVSILLRVFLQSLPSPSFTIAILSAITMTVGNLLAIHQNNLKRLLAYSSIAHVGYIMIGFVACSDIGVQAILIYLFAYLFMNAGAFAIVIAIANKINSEDIHDYSGLSLVNPSLAYTFILFLLSLTGIPPTAGFIGKFYIFSAAIKQNYVWLALIGVINSVISLYYYFRIAYYMFFVPPKETFLDIKKYKSPLFLNFALYICSIMVLSIGIFPQLFVDLFHLHRFTY
jgi:NADH-quinone oxidoreductase subunit N